MSEYDKELDTRTPEYEKAIHDKRSTREKEKGHDQDERPGRNDDDGRPGKKD